MLAHVRVRGRHVRWRPLQRARCTLAHSNAAWQAVLTRATLRDLQTIMDAATASTAVSPATAPPVGTPESILAPDAASDNDVVMPPSAAAEAATP